MNETKCQHSLLRDASHLQLFPRFPVTLLGIVGICDLELDPVHRSLS